MQMPYHTLEMEKQINERVQIVLRSPMLLKAFNEFGAETFRRSSVFHGLDKMLRENGIKGKRCFEVGTWNGLTAAVLSQFFNEVVTVDIAHNELKHQLLAFLGIDNVTCIDIQSNDDKPAIVESMEFDFAYLDGNHAKDTGSDWDLVKNCGRVLFHEAWPFQKPVWELVQSLPFEEVTYGGSGLALWRQS